MKPVFEFDEVHVVSDLHLGGETPSRQIFRQGSLLSALIDSLAARPSQRSVGLVINGDAVDFLAEPQALYFDPENAERKLDDLFGYAEFKPVWEALQRFVSKVRRTLVVNLGNHDLELALPWVRRRLIEKIADGDDRRRGRIVLTFDGTGFLCAVGRAKVLCLHGNEVDGWNETSYEELRRIGRDVHFGRPAESWTPNAGTKLVIDVMNDVKRDFAFVDLLKPETKAVVPALLALKPELMGRAGAVLEVGAKLSYDWLRRKIGFLGEEEKTHEAFERQASMRADQLLAELSREVFHSTARRPTETDVDQLLSEIERHLAAGGEPMDFIAADEAEEHLGKIKAFSDFVRGKEPHQVLREALESLQKDRSFAVDTVDETSRHLDRLVAPDIDFLVAGHTHLERALPRARGTGYYFNSGTWVRLIELRPAVLESDERFLPVWKVLKKGSLAALDAAKKPKLVQDKPAVVSIVAEGSVVRGSLNRVRWSGKRVKLVHVGEVFERN